MEDEDIEESGDKEYYNKIRPRKYILRQRSKTRLFIDMCIICIAIYNSIVLPLMISFDPVK